MVGMTLGLKRIVETNQRSISLCCIIHYIHFNNIIIKQLYENNKMECFSRKWFKFKIILYALLQGP